jgi:hypothetical protein
MNKAKQKNLPAPCFLRIFGKIVRKALFAPPYFSIIFDKSIKQSRHIMRPRAGFGVALEAVGLAAGALRALQAAVEQGAVGRP